MRNYAIRLILPLVVSTAGCASGGTSNAELRREPSDDRADCAVAVADTARPWREVRGAGFTFCVPADWRPTGRAEGADVDPPTWRGGGGWIRWSTREYRPRVLGNVMVPPHQEPIRRFFERIDGRRAELRVWEFQGSHYTRATWRRPRVHFEGETDDRSATGVHLAIYRSVRFVER